MLLEAATEDLQPESYAAAFLGETGNSAGAEDEAPFTMRLLHFRGTFVDELFTTQGKIEQCLRSGKNGWGTRKILYAR